MAESLAAVRAAANQALIDIARNVAERSVTWRSARTVVTVGFDHTTSKFEVRVCDRSSLYKVLEVVPVPDGVDEWVFAGRVASKRGHVLITPSVVWVWGAEL